MKKASILFKGLLMLCMSLALTGCVSKGGESGSKAESKTESKAEDKTGKKTEIQIQGSGSTYECPGTEEGADLSFETVDVNGNPVNSRTLFAQNKVTMINIWATSCGPCINELPELEEMNREFRQKGGAIVGLLDDVWVDNMKYLDEAQAIIKDTGVTYTNLCAWDGYDDVLEAVGTPTTYFVDSNGKLIGESILGAHPDKYRERMEKYLESAK